MTNKELLDALTDIEASLDAISTATSDAAAWILKLQECGLDGDTFNMGLNSERARALTKLSSTKAFKLRCEVHKIMKSISSTED